MRTQQTSRASSPRLINRLIPFKDENELQEIKKVYELLSGEVKPSEEEPVILDYKM